MRITLAVWRNTETGLCNTVVNERFLSLPRSTSSEFTGSLFPCSRNFTVDLVNINSKRLQLQAAPQAQSGANQKVILQGTNLKRYQGTIKRLQSCGSSVKPFRTIVNLEQHLHKKSEKKITVHRDVVKLETGTKNTRHRSMHCFLHFIGRELTT